MRQQILYQILSSLVKLISESYMLYDSYTMAARDFADTHTQSPRAIGGILHTSPRMKRLPLGVAREIS